MLVATAGAKVAGNVSLECWLEPETYLVVPLGFNHWAVSSSGDSSSGDGSGGGGGAGAGAGVERPFALGLLSARLCALAKYSLPPESARFAACAFARDPAKAKVTAWRGATIFTRSDGCMLLVHVSVSGGPGFGGGGFGAGGGFGGEAIEVELGIHDATNLIHARNCLGGGGGGGGFGGAASTFVTVDTVLPGQQQLVAVAAPKRDDER
jgi:hypothetical protein